MKNVKDILGRILVLAVVALIEIGLVYTILHYFVRLATWISVALRLLSVIILLSIVRNSRHLSSDLIYVIIIVLFPVPGTLLYLVLGANLLTSKVLHKIVSETKKAKKYYVQDPLVIEEVQNKDPLHAGEVQYLINQGYPVYHNTHLDYYPLGDAGWPVMLEEMRKAKRYIFMEYFILEEGKMWNAMLEILEQKVKEGVEVRILYDGMGGRFMPGRRWEELRRAGIRTAEFFPPFLGRLNLRVNYRNHRKIVVIDNEVGYVGGFNIGKEYIGKDYKRNREHTYTKSKRYFWQVK